MKIATAHVDLPNETKGGVAAQAHYLANALTDRGHEVTMFTFSPSFPECRYRVHQFTRPKQLRKVSSFLLAARLKQTDFSGFDVLHTHGDNYLLDGRHPQVRTFHGAAKDEMRSAVTIRRRIHQSVMISLELRGAAVADLCVGVSEATRSSIPSVEKIIPCGVDTSRFHSGKKSNNPTVLFVGTTEGRKRGQLLADIFLRDVKPRFPKAELWSVSDKDMTGDGIVNMGRVDFETLTDLFRRAWIFCLPSTYEGFGVPYIEAMASGTAVVATPNPGACEVLRGGKDGIVVNDGELGAALCSLFEHSARRKAMETAGIMRAQAFSWNRVAAQYEELYLDLIESNSRSSKNS